MLCNIRYGICYVTGTVVVAIGAVAVRSRFAGHLISIISCVSRSTLLQSTYIMCCQEEFLVVQPIPHSANDTFIVQCEILWSGLTITQHLTIAEFVISQSRTWKMNCHDRSNFAQFVILTIASTYRHFRNQFWSSSWPRTTSLELFVG